MRGWGIGNIFAELFVEFVCLKHEFVNDVCLLSVNNRTVNALLRLTSVATRVRMESSLFSSDLTEVSLFR